MAEVKSALLAQRIIIMKLTEEVQILHSKVVNISFKLYIVLTLSIRHQPVNDSKDGNGRRILLQHNAKIMQL